MKHRRVVLPLKRKRLGKTDYKARFRLLSSGKPRLVIRKSLRNLTAQVITYEKKGDRVIAASSSNELKTFGLTSKRRNIPTAYLVGYLLAKKAKQKKIANAIFDMGLYAKTKGSVLFACLKGAIDGGMNVPHSKEIFPSEERIKGKHLKDSVSVEDITKSIQQKFGA